MIEITVNGKQVSVEPGELLIRACHGNDVDVPTYCYHPGLSPVGSCRICQVEVRMGDGPSRVMVACRTPVAEGMVVETESEKAHETRRECLEFLLKNHPLDCPICDKAGECDLQDFAYQEGQGEGRSMEPRRKLEKRKDLGDVIVLDQERCILCSRCVRFFEEVTEKPQLCIAERGAHSVVETFADRPLTGNYQGNVADLCPVGALTLKPFRFQARVWNLFKMASTCGECSRGCSTTVEVLRDGQVKRIRPRHNPKVNGYWMCDEGRFAYDGANLDQRLQGAVRRGSSGLEPLAINDALEGVLDVLRSHPENTAIVVSPWLTVEEGRRVARLAKASGVSPYFVSPPTSDLADDILHTDDPCPNRAGLKALGIEGLSAEKLGEVLERTPAALLIGERVVELIGEERLAALPKSVRLMAFESQRYDFPALRLAIGVPNYVERAGTWVNVDGHEGMIGASRSAPQGVRPTVLLLEALEQGLASTEAAR